MKSKYCLDCGKGISKNAIRCKSCAKKGYRNNFYGKEHTLETIEKNRMAHVGKKNPWLTKRNKELSGKKHPCWKGGKITKRGYVYIYKPNHPNATSHGYVREHRLIVERYLNRFLKKTETVHHKDKNPKNNIIENLELFKNNGEHIKYHHDLNKK